MTPILLIYQETVLLASWHNQMWWLTRCKSVKKRTNWQKRIMKLSVKLEYKYTVSKVVKLWFEITISITILTERTQGKLDGLVCNVWDVSRQVGWCSLYIILNLNIDMSVDKLHGWIGLIFLIGMLGCHWGSWMVKCMY